MKQLLIILIGILFSLQINASGVIVLEGHYQGKNLYVQNPFAENGVGFCTFEVTINGEVSTEELNSSAFEIDFSLIALKIGDPVIVEQFRWKKWIKVGEVDGIGSVKESNYNFKVTLHSGENKLELSK